VRSNSSISNTGAAHFSPSSACIRGRLMRKRSEKKSLATRVARTHPPFRPALSRSSGANSSTRIRRRRCRDLRSTGGVPVCGRGPPREPSRSPVLPTPASPSRNRGRLILRARKTVSSQGCALRHSRAARAGRRVSSIDFRQRAHPRIMPALAGNKTFPREGKLIQGSTKV